MLPADFNPVETIQGLAQVAQKLILRDGDLQTLLLTFSDENQIFYVLDLSTDETKEQSYAIARQQMRENKPDFAVLVGSAWRVRVDDLSTVEDAYKIKPSEHKNRVEIASLCLTKDYEQYHLTFEIIRTKDDISFSEPEIMVANDKYELKSWMFDGIFKPPLR